MQDGHKSSKLAAGDISLHSLYSAINNIIRMIK